MTIDEKVEAARALTNLFNGQSAADTLHVIGRFLVYWATQMSTETRKAFAEEIFMLVMEIGDEVHIKTLHTVMEAARNKAKGAQ